MAILERSSFNLLTDQHSFEMTKQQASNLDSQDTIKKISTDMPKLNLEQIYDHAEDFGMESGGETPRLGYSNEYYLNESENLADMTLNPNQIFMTQDNSQIQYNSAERYNQNTNRESTKMKK